MRATINFPLEPHLSDFLRHELNTKEDVIVLNRSNSISRFILSQVQIAEFPRKEKIFDNNVVFKLPSNRFIDFENKFVYVNKFRIQQINDFIKSVFNLRVQMFFFAGREFNYSNKQIIEAFMYSYNIKNLAINYEAIKKNDYRRRIKTIQRISKDIEMSIVQ